MTLTHYDSGYSTSTNSSSSLKRTSTYSVFIESFQFGIGLEFVNPMVRSMGFGRVLFQ